MITILKNIYGKLLTRFYIILIALLTSMPYSISFAEKNLIFAVHPYLPHNELVKKFTPIIDYLSQKIGQKILLKIGSSYDEHINMIGLNQVDIAYMGPASYIKVTNNYGSKPILARLKTLDGPYFYGNIVANKGSGIDTLKDLRGKRIAYGDPNSTMGFLVPHYMLQKSGIFDDTSTTYTFLYQHNNVALGVLSGDFDAGAVKSNVFKKFQSQGLYSIAETPKISEHIFITQSNLSTKTIQSLTSAMHNMHTTPDGLKALHAIKKNITGLVEAKDSDYDNLRKIIGSAKTR